MSDSSPDLFALFFNRDLTAIAFLKFLFINGFVFDRIFFDLIGACKARVLRTDCSNDSYTLAFEQFLRISLEKLPLLKCLYDQYFISIGGIFSKVIRNIV